MGLWRDQQVRELNHVLIDCFFNSPTKRQVERRITEACRLAGWDPNNQYDRDVLFNKLRACRTWEIESEFDNIKMLSEALIPHTKWSKLVKWARTRRKK
jgi:hypothetical protein